MNRAFVTVTAVEPDKTYQGKVGFEAVVSDDYVEDIEIYLMAAPDFLSQPPHVIAGTVAAKDGDAYDVIRDAARNGSSLYVNDEDVDLGALLDQLGQPSPAP